MLAGKLRGITRHRVSERVLIGVHLAGAGLTTRQQFRQFGYPVVYRGGMFKPNARQCPS